MFTSTLVGGYVQLHSSFHLYNTYLDLFHTADTEFVELQQGCICFCSVSVKYIKNPFTELYALKCGQKRYDMIIVYPISIPYSNKNGSDM